jgi:hypothetical protein
MHTKGNFFIFNNNFCVRFSICSTCLKTQLSENWYLNIREKASLHPSVRGEWMKGWKDGGEEDSEGGGMMGGTSK